MKRATFSFQVSVPGVISLLWVTVGWGKVGWWRQMGWNYVGANFWILHIGWMR